MTEFAGLLARVREAKGPDRELDWRIAEAVAHVAFAAESIYWPPFMKGSKTEKSIPLYTASIDAALALVERMLRAYSLRITIDPSGNGADLTWWPDGLTGGRRIQAGGVSSEPPLAILAALLAALSSPTLNSEDK